MIEHKKLESCGSVVGIHPLGFNSGVSSELLLKYWCKFCGTIILLIMMISHDINFFAHNAVDVSLGNSLPGSCIAAGYISCCDSEVDVVGNCAGDTGSCFCDPSCREYSDCCSDLDEICPQKGISSYNKVY